jgi:hypothetical protein
MSIKTIWYTKIWPWMKKYWVVAIDTFIILVAYGKIFELNLKTTER